MRVQSEQGEMKRQSAKAVQRGKCDSNQGGIGKKHLAICLFRTVSQYQCISITNHLIVIQLTN